MSSSKKSNNTKNSSKSKAKTNNKNQDKKVFTTKTSYQEAVSKENAKIHNSENRIEELKKMLSNLDTTKKSKVESKKVVNKKPKTVNGISTSQKHTVMSVSEAEKYNYKVRLSSWRKNAGYNEKQHTCSKCKEQCHTSILLDNGSHICYFCWIRKPKSTVTKSNIKKTSAKKQASNNQKKKK